MHIGVNTSDKFATGLDTLSGRLTFCPQMSDI